jgi:hypothetical protein
MSGYTVSTRPGRVEGADTIPEALDCLARQMVEVLPAGPVAWCVIDPAGTEHRGVDDLNGRSDLLVDAIEDLAQTLYVQLHKAADGGVPLAWLAGHRR